MNFRDQKYTTADWTDALLISDRITTVIAVIAVILLALVGLEIAIGTGVVK